MIKKIAYILVWMLLIAWFTVMMSFVSDKHETILCKQISISISDSNTVSFVTQESVREMIIASGQDLQGYPVNGIQTRELESMLEKNQYISNAELYVTIEGDLNVEIEQHKPLLRVMPKGRKGFYIDHNGNTLQLSENYSPMILPVTGYLEMPSAEDKGSHYMDEIQDFARFVAADPFWSKQIVQLYRGRNGDFEIVPRVGAHQIIIGDLAGFEVKLRNLKALYDQGLEQNGWNTYNKINLKYSDQIICTKR